MGTGAGSLRPGDAAARLEPGPGPGTGDPGPWEAYHDKALAAAEKTYLRELLRFSAGDFPQAKARSGLSQARLYSLLKKHGLRSKK